MTRSVLVVAHPDDETMWFAGIVLSNPGDWDIICCSVPVSDPIRAWKFFDACKVLGGFPRLIFSAETPGGELHNLELLDLEGYDRIVTHGVEGGYGHAAHKQLYRIIHERWPNKEIWSDCPPDKPDSDIVLYLSTEDRAKKLKALECYDHVLPYDGVEMTKCAALLKRYIERGPWDLGIERYRIHRG